MVEVQTAVKSRYSHVGVKKRRFKMSTVSHDASWQTMMDDDATAELPQLLTAVIKVKNLYTCHLSLSVSI